MRNFREVLKEQQEQIRRDWKAMARIYPGCFDKNGRPIVAELPPLPEYAPTRDLRAKE